TSTCRRTSPCSARGRSRTRAAAPRRPSPPRAAAACGPRARSSPSAESGGPPLDLRPLQLEPVAGARAVGPQHPRLRLGHAVEQQALDPHVVVEVLEVAPALDRAE